MRDSRLIDAYIDALRRDPHAAPPPGLDPALAEVARQVVQAEHCDPPDDTTLDRMWLHAQTLARDTARPRPSTNGHQSDNHRQGFGHKERRDMTVIARRQEWVTLPHMGRLMALAAMLAVVIFGGFLLSEIRDNATPSGPGIITILPEEVHMALFERYIDVAWNAGDVTVLDQMVTDDVVRHEARYVHGARAPTANRRAVSLSP